VSKRPTMADVARSCGVTAATVSRVLNHKKKNFSATAEVRKKIWNSTRDLRYAPDSTARSLSLGTSRVVGVFGSPQARPAEGVNESMIEGIAEILHEAGCDIFFELTPMRRMKHPLPMWRFDGAVLMQAPSSETVAELDAREVPYIGVNERVSRAVANVLADDAMGMNRAVSHLTQLGHRRIGYANVRVDGATHYSVFDRHNALLAASRNGVIQLVEGHDMPFDSPAEFIHNIVLKNSATAIIAYDHRKAVTLLGAAQSMGLNVPDDFSLICFNDVFPVRILYPPLTTVVVPGHEMGRTAAHLLLNHLVGAPSKFGKEVRIPEDLIVRGSTALENPKAGVFPEN
jgi:DNA-binding LacI/PurR family transcriptional regulator